MLACAWTLSLQPDSLQPIAAFLFFTLRPSLLSHFALRRKNWEPAPAGATLRLSGPLTRPTSWRLRAAALHLHLATCIVLLLRPPSAGGVRTAYDRVCPPTSGRTLFVGSPRRGPIRPLPAWHIPHTDDHGLPSLRGSVSAASPTPLPARLTAGVQQPGSHGIATNARARVAGPHVSPNPVPSEGPGQAV